MSTSLTYLQGTVQTVLSTELDSLANGALAPGSAIALTSAGYPSGDVELVVTFGAAPAANTGVSLWFLRDPDGVNHEDGGTSVTPARLPDVVIPVRAVTTAQRITVPGVALPAGTFKVLALNDGTGQAMASSGNTVKIRPYTFSQA